MTVETTCVPCKAARAARVARPVEPPKPTIEYVVMGGSQPDVFGAIAAANAHAAQFGGKVRSRPIR